MIQALYTMEMVIRSLQFIVVVIFICFVDMNDGRLLFTTSETIIHCAMMLLLVRLGFKEVMKGNYFSQCLEWNCDVIRRDSTDILVRSLLPFQKKLSIHS